MKNKNFFIIYQNPSLNLFIVMIDWELMLVSYVAARVNRLTGCEAPGRSALQKKYEIFVGGTFAVAAARLKQVHERNASLAGWFNPPVGRSLPDHERATQQTVHAIWAEGVNNSPWWWESAGKY